jgi:hypothetical protein
MSVNTIENTPKGCHGCHKFDDCVQAKHMNANTEPVDGWVYDGEVYCADCNGDTHCHYGDEYGGESDSPTHCGGCGVPIIHELTIEGVEYVRESLANGAGCCDELWRAVWADYDVEPDCDDDDDWDD